jgi:hypothetical protein
MANRTIVTEGRWRVSMIGLLALAAMLFVSACIVVPVGPAPHHY